MAGPRDVIARAFIGVGSNIAPEENVLAALRLLGREVRVVAVSTFYRTRAEGRLEQPDFHNGVIEVTTELSPRELKGSLQRIEDRLGRRRTADRFAPRPIDLDLLLYGDLHVAEEDLRLPDPDIARRPFLAFPLRELASELRLPGSALTLGEIAAALSPEGMEPLGEYTRLLRKEIAHEP